MLFCVVSPAPGRSRHHLAQRRKPIVQLSLPLLETALSALAPWRGAPKLAYVFFRPSALLVCA